MVSKKETAASAGKQSDAASIKLFCRKLTNTGLMDLETVQTLWNSFSKSQRPRNARELADELIRRDRLTPYQCERITAGSVEKLVLGCYTILDHIGEGAMGHVLKARHEKMRRDVALKIISQKIIDSPLALERFEQETRAAAQLSHPNIVAAYDAGEQDGTHYLAMEYVDGQDLASILASKGQLRIALACDYVIQAAEGFEYAHRKGIIHRDIKPSNLLVDSSGTVKILDMGMAFFASQNEAADQTADQRLTQHGEILGTGAYMSPEQALNVRSVDGRSDIYSLGCTLFHLLTGQRPYHADTIMGILIAHRESPIPSIRSLRPEVPVAIERIFQRMVAKQPDFRYASMGEVVAALRQNSSGLSPGGSGYPAIETGPSTTGRSNTQPSFDASKEIEQTQAMPDMNSALSETIVVSAADDDTLKERRFSRQRVFGSRSATMVLAGVALAFFFVAALGIMFAMQTPKGTLVVESKDPTSEVEIKQHGEIVEIVDANDDWQIRLKEGEYEVSLRGTDDKFEIDRRTITVTRGEIERLRVTFKPNETETATNNNESTQSEPVDVAEVELTVPDPLESGPSQPGPESEVQSKPNEPTGSGEQSDSPQLAMANDNPKQLKPEVVAAKTDAKPELNIKPKATAAASSETPLLIDAKPKLTLLHSMLGHSSWVQRVAFSPDGKMLASGGIDGRAVIWDVRKGRILNHFTGIDRVYGLAFSPDSKSLAITGDHKRIGVFDCRTAKLVSQISDLPENQRKNGNTLHTTLAAAWSPAGDTLATGDSDNELILWNAANGKQRTVLKEHFEDIWSIVYASDGITFASSSWDGTARIWDAKTYKLRHTLNTSDSTVYAIAYSKDNKQLFTAGNATKVIEWDVETGKQTRVIASGVGVVISLAVSSDGRLLASTSTENEVIRFYDIATGRDAGVSRDSAAKYVAFSPVDPTLFATCSNDKTVRIWRYEGFERGEADFLVEHENGAVTIRQEVADDHTLIAPWQNFKAPIDGHIHSIELRPNFYQGCAGKLSIYSEKGIGGKLLHSQEYASPSVSGAPWTTFRLPEPLPVEKDSPYTWELTGAGGLKYSDSNRYPHGGAAGGTRDMCFRIHFTPNK